MGGRIRDGSRTGFEGVPPGGMVGMRARRTGKRFSHTGTIVADFPAGSGERMVVIEFDEPVFGMLFIYPADGVIRI